MVDVVERSAVYEMLDKIQSDVYDGDGFQLDKWVEYVDAMKCEKERIMTEDMFERAKWLIDKIGDTKWEIDKLSEAREKMCAAKDGTEDIALNISCRSWCGCVYTSNMGMLIKIVDEEIARQEAELVSAKKEFEAL